MSDPFSLDDTADRLEMHQAALSFLAAGLAGDVEAGKLIWDTTSHQALVIGIGEIAAHALKAAGENPAAWVAAEQARAVACLATRLGHGGRVSFLTRRPARPNRRWPAEVR
jgi:hypothetical protein